MSNLLLSAGPSNVNLTEGEGMLRIPSMPRISSVGDLVKRTVSSEALASLEQQQAAIAARKWSSNAAGIMAGRWRISTTKRNEQRAGASPRGFVPLPTDVELPKFTRAPAASPRVTHRKQEKDKKTKKGAATKNSMRIDGEKAARSARDIERGENHRDDVSSL